MVGNTQHVVVPSVTQEVLSQGAEEVRPELLGSGVADTQVSFVANVHSYAATVQQGSFSISLPNGTAAERAYFVLVGQESTAGYTIGMGAIIGVNSVGEPSGMELDINIQSNYAPGMSLSTQDRIVPASFGTISQSLGTSSCQ